VCGVRTACGERTRVYEGRTPPPWNPPTYLARRTPNAQRFMGESHMSDQTVTPNAEPTARKRTSNGSVKRIEHTLHSCMCAHMSHIDR
jgi:hypothetical protein